VSGPNYACWRCRLEINSGAGLEERFPRTALAAGQQNRYDWPPQLPTVSQGAHVWSHSTYSSESAARGAGFASRCATVSQVSPHHGEERSSPEDLVPHDSE
jgi:hypothetical protein